MKLSGLCMNVVGFGYAARAKPPSSDELAEHWAPLVDHCIECFGVGRCMFASNFPVDKVGGTERQGAGCRVQCHTLQLTPHPHARAVLMLRYAHARTRSPGELQLQHVLQRLQEDRAAAGSGCENRALS